MNLSYRPRLVEPLVCRPENDGAFLLNPDTGDLTWLNRTALEVYRLMDGEKDLGAILSIFSRRYPQIDAVQLQADIQASLDDFDTFIKPAGIDRVEADDRGVATLPEYPLTSLYIYLSSRCNLRCGHCWINPPCAGAGMDWLDTALLKDALAEALPLGLGSVKFSGGEPLLHPEWKSALAASVDLGLAVILETNGTLIDAEAAHFLKRMNAFVSISLDAAEAGSHDRIRGVAGAYEKTLHAMDCLAEAGIAFQIIMTLQKENCSQVSAVLDLADRFKAGSVKINPLIPCGRGVTVFDQGGNLTVDKLLQLYAETRAVAGSFPDLEIFFDLPPAFQSTADLTTGGLQSCRILNILGILANGDISICGIGQEHPELRMGNISGDKIADVWKANSLLARLRTVLPKQLQPPCDNCIFQFQCMGGCRALAFASEGDLLAPFFLCREMHAAGRFPASRKIHTGCG